MPTPRNVTREQIRYKASLAARTNRYRDMANYMKELVTAWASPSSELTPEERGLLHAAYEKLICPLRRAWMTVLKAEQDKEAKKNGDRLEQIQRYRVDLEHKISLVCSEILELLEETLVPSASSSETKVSYLTMRGDYYRYLAEFLVDDDCEKAAYAAMIAYRTAENIAVAELGPVHPTRLGLLLNFSVFYYQILNLRDDAYQMATKAITEASTELRTTDEKLPYKNTLPIMTLLERNLHCWSLDNYSGA